MVPAAPGPMSVDAPLTLRMDSPVGSSQHLRLAGEDTLPEDEQ